MKQPNHIVVIDAIAYAGGSKVATNNLLLSFAGSNHKITIVTNDETSWSHRFVIIPLIEPHWLAIREQGLCYFLRHFMIALHLVFVRLRVGKIDLAIGASGPGVDLSIYLGQKLFGYKITQLIHGPVARSCTIARCLVQANHVFYLQSSLSSIRICLHKTLTKMQLKTLLTSAQFHRFSNGICNDTWPSQCQYHTPHILWAASLLKWKGLDFFIATISAIPLKLRPTTEICYIRPHVTAQAISKAPIIIPKLYWHQQPSDLDMIRANCNIFISTSRNEPFGLSILEALAAGLCVIIPRDNAYWDQTLCHDIDCIKYHANNLHDLAERVLSLCADVNKIREIGLAGQQITSQYRAVDTYDKIKDIVLNSSTPTGER